jgi:hypothetical protein
MMDTLKEVLKLFSVKFEFVLHTLGFNHFIQGLGTAKEYVNIFFLIVAISRKDFSQKFVVVGCVLVGPICYTAIVFLFLLKIRQQLKICILNVLLIVLLVE